MIKQEWKKQLDAAFVSVNEPRKNEEHQGGRL